MFASASPIINFDEDRLGYELFARSLALGIANRTNITEPYIVGIDAAWGMGKTSAVNLVHKGLEEYSAQNPSDAKRVHIHHFSPWLLASLDALALTYIAELTGAIDKSFGHRLGHDWKKQRKKILKRYGNLISAAAGAATEYYMPGFGTFAGKAGRALTEIADESTEALGRDLKNRLARLDAGQLVIIIDDLDRLHSDEMRNLLSLVMTFGSLPRVTHLLLYDRAIVDGAMKRSLGHGMSGGPTYLEKIVQLPTALPAADPILLRDFFFLRLNACIASITPQDESRLRELWRTSLRRILNSPRDITRLANSLAATWSSVSDHAELADFIGIEALRILRPLIWNSLCRQRRVLVGEHDPTLSRGPDTPTAEELSDGSGPAVEALIAWLFPRTNKRSNERGQRSIASPNSVDVYFRFQPGPVVAKSRTQSLLQLANWKDLADSLASMGNRLELRSILSDLAEEPQFAQLSPEDIFLAFIECADSLIAGVFRSPPALHDIEMFRDLDELLWNSFARVQQDRRAALFRRAADQAASVSMVAIVWQRLCLRGGLLQYRTSRPELLLSESEVIALGAAVATRLTREAQDSKLSKAPMLGWVLRIWGDTGETASLQKATTKLLDSDWGFLNIIDGLMGHAVSSSDGAYRSLHRDTSIPGYDLQTIRLAASKYLADNKVPSEITTVGIDLLEAFVNAEEWEEEPLPKH